MRRKEFRFEELRVYQKSLDFIDMAYSIANSFPSEEKYRLTSQFIRGATSISLNIAEGAGDTNSQFQRFLKIAQGSINECVVCISIAQRQGFISKDIEEECRNKLVELRKMTNSLINYLSKPSED